MTVPEDCEDKPATFSCDELLDAIVAKGYFIADDFLSPTLTQALRDEVWALEAQGMAAAGVGRGQQFQLDESIRADKIHWFDGTSPAQSQFLQQCDELRGEINRQLFMGLYDFEAHFSVYQSGDFYQKHLDAFKGRSNRVLSCVFYLNESWQADWGGELALYDEDHQLLGDVLPRGGRAIFFLSERFPHEVRVTSKRRLSIAGWFRINETSGRHLDPST